MLQPWIQEIELPSIHKDIPNKSIYLDHSGNLYIGNENGVSIIDEQTSEKGYIPYHLFLDGPVYLADLAGDSLFYASESDFGYLVRDDKSQWQFLSRKHWIPASRRSFVPSGVIRHNNQHFILTDRGVVAVSGAGAEMFFFPDGVPRLFPAGDQLYLSAKGNVIQQWNGEAFQDLPGNVRFMGDSVIYIGLEDGILEIISSTMNSYVYDPGETSFKRTGILPFSEDIVHLQRIGGSLMLAHLKNGGLSIVDLSGNTCFNIGEAKELAGESVEQVLIRNGKEIWILTPHSLLTLMWPSPYSYLELDAAVTGRILTADLWNDQLVLGTSEGVFSLIQKEGEPGTRFLNPLTPSGSASVHLLNSNEQQLFAAGLGGLYAISPDTVEQIDTGSYSGIVLLNTDTLLASNETGLILYSHSGNGWKRAWIDPALSFSNSFVNYETQLFFLNRNQIFRFNTENNRATMVPFQRDELLDRLFLRDGNLYLVAGSREYLFDKNEWIFQPLTGTASDGMDALAEDSIPVFQHIGRIVHISQLDSLIYITGTNSFSVLNLELRKHRPPELPIQIESPVREKRMITLFFSGLRYQTYPEPLFRYRVIPGVDEWSNWSFHRDLTISGLNSGKYMLSVQAKDLYGNLSEPATLSFNVKPPLSRTWYAYLLYSLVLILVLFIIRKWQLLSYQRAETGIIRRQLTKKGEMMAEKEEPEIEKDESTEELKRTTRDSRSKGKWDKYDRVTVLFSDIQGFTQIAEEMNPEALIDELDKFFFHFDSVVEKYNIEKIKTIGDAYMAAGGIPHKNSTNPVEVVLAALEMQVYMQELKASKARIWDLRIGIHTGPVIAGVVGHKKVSYDIWGDTVNTASRMESSGEPGKVNISEGTYKLVKDYFICEYRGKLPVKYKGKIDMYFVKGLRPELSVDLKMIPNKRFFTNLQFLRLIDLEEKVFNELLAELPETIHFHNVLYIRKVYNQAQLLCRAEEIEQEEMLMVRTAVLMLYTGLTSSPDNFENQSTIISREVLPEYNYSEFQINQICNLILSTKMPFEPRNLSEKIMIDARMEYLGKPDYTSNLRLLYQEFKDNGAKINGQQFKHQQLEFLYSFEFFTVSGKRLREVSATDQMASLEQERWI